MNMIDFEMESFTNLIIHRIPILLHLSQSSSRLASITDRIAVSLMNLNLRLLDKPILVALCQAL